MAHLDYSDLLNDYLDYYLYNMTKKETKFIRNYISCIRNKIKEFIKSPKDKLFIEEIDINKCDSRVKIGGLYYLANSLHISLIIEKGDSYKIYLSK